MVEMNFTKAEICVAEGSEYFPSRLCKFGKCAEKRMRVFVAQQNDYMTGLVVGLTEKMRTKKFCKFEVEMCDIEIAKRKELWQETKMHGLYPIAGPFC